MQLGLQRIIEFLKVSAGDCGGGKNPLQEFESRSDMFAMRDNAYRLLLERISFAAGKQFLR